FDAQGYENRPEVLARLGDVLARDACASGLIPRLAVVMGRCIGADALLASGSDLLFMVSDQSSLFITGSEIVTAVTGDTLSEGALGGANLHVENGVAAGAYDNECEALLALRRLVDFLPAAGDERKQCDDLARQDPSLATLVPDEATRSYDVKEPVFKICDKDAFFELHEPYAQNIVTGFGRIEGRSVGVIANQPLVLAGALDLGACRKAARFVDFCARFHLPIVSLIDTPGFLPGVAEEHGGVLREASVLCAALARAPSPKIIVVLRNAIGAAALAMGVGNNNATIFAWPSARIALTGGAADIPLASASANPAVRTIAPAETRAQIVEALRRMDAAR
ncbi:MAG TPA: carboxyl transferase domain-containing protein, partial [Methylovirgula sp.]